MTNKLSSHYDSSKLSSVESNVTNNEDVFTVANDNIATFSNFHNQSTNGSIAGVGDKSSNNTSFIAKSSDANKQYKTQPKKTDDSRSIEAVNMVKDSLKDVAKEALVATTTDKMIRGVMPCVGTNYVYFN